MTEEKRSEHRRNKLKTWLDQHTQTQENLKPLHIASLTGNIELIKLFVKHGADIHAKSAQGASMIHMAAKGDQPVSMFYFKE